ncbi:MAG: BatA domain-containing protein [Kiritimatiellia bacterium]
MSFLIPAFLLALPLALLPVIIHLLNRLRFKTVKWAAMMFLLSANRASTRRARIRHWLILASRCLMLAMLLLAVARPVLGGVLGASLSGAPDTVVLLLDRSASMETVDPRQQVSRRAHAINLFAKAAATTAQGSRFVLIDSAGRAPTEVGNVAALGEVAAAQATGTASDIPALLKAAVDYLGENPAGRSEIWLASDLQASNWRTQSRDWADLQSRLSALSGDVRLRVLALHEPVAGDHALTLRGVRNMSVAGKRSILVDYTVQLSRDVEGGKLPVDITLNGIRNRAEIPVTGREMLLTRRLDLPAEPASGWARLELPADPNRVNNSIHFAYGPQPFLNAVVAVADEASARLATLAVGAREGVRGVQTLDLAALETADLSKTALVIAQAGAVSEAVRAKLETFATAGGRVLFLPPVADAVAGPMGLGWRPVEKADAAKPWKVTTWDPAGGPLANTSSGRSLPLVELDVLQRRIPHVASGDPADTASWNASAGFGDGSAFLLQRVVGRGAMFALGTLPGKAWSTLGDGVVWVPALQRLLQEGGDVLAVSRTDVCGLWRPSGDAGGVWESAAGAPTDSPATTPGVYRLGTSLVALNPPASELDPAQVASADVPGLLPGSSVQVLADLQGGDASGTTSEVWRAVLVLSLLFMIFELVLLLGERLPAVTPEGPAGRKETA